MLFADIIGQEELKANLIRTVADNRISHARLFLGPEGAGSLPLAIAYGQYVNCARRSAGDSCGTCPSCRKYAKLIHPDLHFVFPVVKAGSGKASVSDMYINEWRTAVGENPYLTYNQWLGIMGDENKQGGIFVDESSEILKKLSFKSYEAEYKVMIIWMAEKMNVQTANKLLKILEEPSEKTLFLLIAESSDLMLTTILSRTQLTRVPKLDTADLAVWLMQRTSCGEQQASDAARLSNGNAALALTHLQSEQSDEQFFEWFTGLVRAAYSVWGNKRGMLDLLRLCEELSALKRESLKAFLRYCLRMVRENFVLNRQQPQLALLTAQESAFSAKFSPFINPGNVAYLMDELNTAHYHIESNGSPRIVMTDLGCRLVMAFRH